MIDGEFKGSVLGAFDKVAVLDYGHFVRLFGPSVLSHFDERFMNDSALVFSGGNSALSLLVTSVD